MSSSKDGSGTIVITGNHAVSYAVKMARVQVVAAYPITPQTQVVELLSKFCEDGIMDARFIKVESEHTSMASLIGASSAGARTFTATSSQGLALMHEMLHWAAGARTPIVMANINRALGAPWSIWTDQNDSLSQRDTGWIQYYCESNQEVFDTVLQAYRVAESVLVPVMLVMDAFVLSHTAEPVDIPTQEKIDSYLPPFTPKIKLDTNAPAAYHGLATPDYYMEFRKKLQDAQDLAKEVITSVDDEFGETFGRKYGQVELYGNQNPDILLVTSGTVTGTAREVIDALNAEGKNVALLKIRIFRPFPSDQVREACAKAGKVAVLDRNIGFGVGGIFAQEIRAALYGYLDVPVQSYIAGLGGRDITPHTIREVLRMAEASDENNVDSIWVGVKE